MIKQLFSPKRYLFSFKVDEKVERFKFPLSHQLRSNFEYTSSNSKNTVWKALFGKPGLSTKDSPVHFAKLLFANQIQRLYGNKWLLHGQVLVE